MINLKKYSEFFKRFNPKSKSVDVRAEVEPTIFTISKFDDFACTGYIASTPVDGEVLKFWSDHLENESLDKFKKRLSRMVKYSKVKFVEEFNESWKSAVAGLLLLFNTSCNSVVINGTERNVDNFETEGVVTNVSKIPMGKNGCMYDITIKDNDGDVVKIQKYALIPFTNDETSSVWLLSDLEKGSKVKVVCKGDCKVYLIK